MLHIVIPAYNEEARLPRTLRALRRYVAAHRSTLGHVQVTVVDNASDDRTALVAQQADDPALPVRVVSCPVRGKGAAVRAGLLAATDPAADQSVGAGDLVCFMDADGATELGALDLACTGILRGADVVIGSRSLDGSVAEARHCATRARGAAWYRSLARRLLPDLTDTQCGFKLFRAELVREAAEGLTTHGFSFDVELLVRLRRRGARIVEIPVVWVDVPGSTFVPLRHGARSFLDLAKIAWRVRDVAPSAPGTAPAMRGPLAAALPAAFPALAAAIAPLAAAEER